MKTRSDFVSNSSSSSFIVISDEGKDQSASIAKRFYGEEEIGVPFADYGCKEFGWQTEKYYDVFSKINWAALILLTTKRIEEHSTPEELLKQHVGKPWSIASDMEALLKKVCKEHLGISIFLRQKDPNEDPWGSDRLGYIDHQSDAGESPENALMFESEKSLVDFLFNDASYIDNSNDNGGRDEEY